MGIIKKKMSVQDLAKALADFYMPCVVEHKKRLEKSIGKEISDEQLSEIIMFTMHAVTKAVQTEVEEELEIKVLDAMHAHAYHNMIDDPSEAVGIEKKFNERYAKTTKL